MSDNENYSCPADDHYSDDSDWEAPVFFKNSKPAPPPRRTHFGTRRQRFLPSLTTKEGGSSTGNSVVERKITPSPTPATSLEDQRKTEEKVEEKTQVEKQVHPPAKRGHEEDKEDDGQTSQERKKPRTSKD